MDAEHDTNGITLRQAERDDRELLLGVYAAGREIELSLVPWDEGMKMAFVEHQFDAQDAFYQSEMPGSTQEVILLDGEPAGRLYSYRADDEIAILDLAILPQFRRKGIASSIIRSLQAEAGRSRKGIRIFIESFNPSASLLTKLGFRLASDDGMNRKYEWRPENR